MQKVVFCAMKLQKSDISCCYLEENHTGEKFHVLGMRVYWYILTCVWLWCKCGAARGSSLLNRRKEGVRESKGEGHCDGEDIFLQKYGKGIWRRVVLLLFFRFCSAAFTTHSSGGKLGRFHVCVCADEGACCAPRWCCWLSCAEEVRAHQQLQMAGQRARCRGEYDMEK